MTGNVVPWRWKKRKVPVGGQEDVVSHIQRQVQKIFNDVTGSRILPGFVSEPLVHLGERLTTFAPNVNVRKGPHAVVISVELPGMDERDIELSLTSEGLTIRGERKLDVEDSSGSEWNYLESPVGPFERIVPLDGLRVQEDKVEATASKGIVTIVLPLRSDVPNPAKKVEIKPS